MQPKPSLWYVLYHYSLVTKGYQGGHMLSRRVYYRWLKNYVAVNQLPFDRYWIIWNDCVCLFQYAFCTPLIIVAMSWFCSGLTFFVVNEAVLLVILLFFLRSSFTACSPDGSFSICCRVLQLSRNYSYLPYHLVGLLMSTPFSLWFLSHFPSSSLASTTPTTASSYPNWTPLPALYHSNRWVDLPSPSIPSW